MSKPSQTKNVYVQTLPDGKCLCPDFRAIKIFCAFIVRSKFPMSRLSCVQKTLCPDLRAFKIAYVRHFVCSKPKIVRCNIYILCVFVETMLSLVFPDRVILNARPPPPCAFISDWTYRLLVWHLYLGIIVLNLQAEICLMDATASDTPPEMMTECQKERVREFIYHGNHQISQLDQCARMKN